MLGHDKSDHLGLQKVSRLIGKKFVWSFISRDINKPVLTKPFDDIAIYIVDPLEKGKGVCRFLLKYVYQLTSWPDECF